MNSSRSTTLTFLFTDIQDSTRLWEQHPNEMRTALAHHVALARESGAMRTLAYGLNVMLLGLLSQGEFDVAEPIAEEAIAISRQYGYDLELITTLGSFSPVFDFQGRHE